MVYDENGYNPREDDNLGHMVCFHNKYTLGDKTVLKSEDFTSWEELKRYIKKELKAIYILPLFLYDHSGISIRTFPHGHHVNWDCGQIGFIYCTKEDLKKIGITKSRIEKSLISEVETYNQYIQGEVYCLVKEVYNDLKIRNDSLGDICSGYLGRDYAEKALLTDI